MAYGHRRCETGRGAARRCRRDRWMRPHRCADRDDGCHEDRSIRQHFPALVDAARTVGSVQIRNRATLAGNLCNASPAADTAPVLLAHRASLNLVSAGGSGRCRWMTSSPVPGEPGWRQASWSRRSISRSQSAHGRSVWPAHAAAWSRSRDRLRLLRRSGIRRGPFCLWRRRAPPVRRHVAPGCTARRSVDARAPYFRCTRERGLPARDAAGPTRRALREAVGRMREASEGA